MLKIYADRDKPKEK